MAAEKRLRMTAARPLLAGDRCRTRYGRGTVKHVWLGTRFHPVTTYAVDIRYRKGSGQIGQGQRRTVVLYGHEVRAG